MGDEMKKYCGTCDYWDDKENPRKAGVCLYHKTWKNPGDEDCGHWTPVRESKEWRFIDVIKNGEAKTRADILESHRKQAAGGSRGGKRRWEKWRNDKEA